MASAESPELNPQPKQAYDIIITIHGAPGPFDSVTGDIGYNIVNAADCAYQDPLSGVHYTPGYGKSFILHKVKEGVYRFTVYLDLLVDQDYYGKGVCHWKLHGFSATATVHGANFFTGLTSEEIISGKSVTGYQQKRLYLDAGATDMNIAPESVSELQENGSDKYFTITVTSVEAGHE